MSKTTINRFLTILSSAKELERARLYQLLKQAEACYCLRDRRGQYEFGKALSLFSHPFDAVGEYYQATYLHKLGQKELAYEKLEHAKEAPGGYRDKAILTLSGMKQVDQEPDDSYRLRFELQKSESLPIVIESNIGIASLLSAEGRHQKALDQLESIMPLLKEVGMTPLFYDVLNSYAVELAEIGKLDEASQVITPVLASPYIWSYPNWLETANEIREKSRRSIVTIGTPFTKESRVVEFPYSEARPSQEPRGPIETPFSDYIESEFRLTEKVEDWVYEGAKPDDLGTLMFALARSENELERELIIERVIQSTLIHTEEGKEARGKWENRIVSKMKK